MTDPDAPQEPADQAPVSDAPEAEVASVPTAALAPGAPAPRLRRRVALFLVAFAVGLVAVLAVAGVGVAAWDAGYQDRVLLGVHVAGVDLSGLDRAGAAAAIDAAFPYGQGSLVLHAPSADITVPYSAFDRHADTQALVDAALALGRAGDLPTRFVAELGQAIHGITLAPRVVYDRGKLAVAVTAALKPLSTAPLDATISMADTGPATTPSRHGTAVDATPVIEAAEAAVGRVDAAATTVIPVTVDDVAPLFSDAAAQTAATQAGQVIGDLTLKFSKKTWVVKASTVRTWVGFLPNPDGTFTVMVDATKIPASLAAIGKAIAKPASSAIYLRAKGGKIVGVGASSDGRQLDTATTTQNVSDALLARITTGQNVPVGVAAMPVTPKLTTEEAKLKAPVLTMLGTWTTWFPISDHNYYGANIWIPAQIINGTMLAPGQTFDWWNTVGQVTPARGFGPGGVIAGDHTDPTGALGGGMCSSSTTLFNAALRAGLQMGARGNHRYYISRYPLGLDATVWKMGGAVQDMSFTNDTASPILIVGLKSRSGSTGYVTYQLWGTPDGRTVSLSAPSVSNVIRATTKTVYVTTLPHGVRQQTEFPSNQMDVAVSRVVRKGGNVIHSELWQSHYVLWNGVIQVGQ